MSGARIRLGTRASRLALIQADIVATALRASGITVELVEIVTAGDVRTPDTPWGEGAFVDALEGALRRGEVDAAVHSAKDMPIRDDGVEDLVVAAYLERADPRDVLVTRAGGATLAELPAGSTVGTDSPRRTGFVLAARPDLRVVPLHGNVDTRIRRLDEGEVDGLVLAAAGLERLGLSHRIDEHLDPAIVPPAPGQGALAVQVRADDAATTRSVAAIDDRRTRLAVEAEREVLAATGGGCRSPVGSLAVVDGEAITLLAGWTTLDGARTAVVRRRGAPADASDLSREVAARLVVDSDDAKRPRVLVTRAAHQVNELLVELALAGVEGVSVPAIEIEPAPPGGSLDAAARQLHRYAWVVVTSPNGAWAVLRAVERAFAPREAPSWAAVGTGTSRVLEAEGIEVRHRADVPTAAALAATLPIRTGDSVLAVRGDLVDGSLPDALRSRGAIVDDVVGYRTCLAPIASRAPLRDALASGRPDAVAFTSASTVAGFVALAQGSASPPEILRIPAICFGRGSTEAARAEGFQVMLEADPSSAADMAARVASAFADRSTAVTR